MNRTAIRGSALSAVIGLLLALTGAVAVTVLTAPAAQAACSSQLPGTWHNIDPNTPSMTQVTIEMNCGDVRLCNAETGVCTGGTTTYTIRTFGRCHPTDCDWGTRPAVDMGDGWQRATYAYSWATKQVWVKNYQFYGRTYLRVWVYTDFTPADGRTDTTNDVWMLP